MFRFSAGNKNFVKLFAGVKMKLVLKFSCKQKFILILLTKFLVTTERVEIIDLSHSTKIQFGF